MQYTIQGSIDSGLRGCWVEGTCGVVEVAMWWEVPFRGGWRSWRTWMYSPVQQYNTQTSTVSRNTSEKRYTVLYPPCHSATIHPLPRKEPGKEPANSPLPYHSIPAIPAQRRCNPLLPWGLLYHVRGRIIHQTDPYQFPRPPLPINRSVKLAIDQSYAAFNGSHAVQGACVRA